MTTASAYKNLDFYGKLYEVSPERCEENIKQLLSLMGIWDLHLGKNEFVTPSQS